MEIILDEFAVAEINKENWKKAKGIKYHRGETNAALAKRDYTIDCALSLKICVIKGYWIWWCSVHHLPSCLCELAIAKNKIRKMEDVIKEVAKVVIEL